MIAKPLNAVLRGAIIQSASEITQLITAHKDGDASAYDRAIELLYDEIHIMAHGQLSRQGQHKPFQTTELVNEAYIKLKDSSGRALNRSHFLALAAICMRHILIDFARSRNTAKRGNGVKPVEFEDHFGAVSAQAEELLRIDEALTALGAHNERLQNVFICKFFGGYDDDETADALNLSKRTAQRDWMKARAFLTEHMVEIN